MKIFDIRVVQDAVPVKRAVAVKQGGEAIVRFTVTNVSGRDLRALVRLVPENDEHMAWLRIDGGNQRKVAKGQSDNIVVKIRPPKDASPGAGTFWLVLASEDDPDEHLAEAAARFTVEPGPAPEPRPRPWWIVAAAAGVVVAAAVLAVLLWPQAGVYAITDVMVTDDPGRVPGEYTGVSRDQPTTPYIPGQVGVGVRTSDVNEGIPPDEYDDSKRYPGSETSIWVKYERLPRDSDKPVLVDIEVCRWEPAHPQGTYRWDWKDPDTKEWLVKWEEHLPGPGWEAASGYSTETNDKLLDPGIDKRIKGGLTTGLPWQIHRKGLAVKYEPLSEAPTRIIGLHLGSAPRAWEILESEERKYEVRYEYLKPQEPVVYDLEGRPAYEQRRAGIDIQSSDHHVPAGSLYLMKHVVPPSVPTRD